MIRRVARNLSWRRGILLVATVAVGITLLARERHLEAWTAEVVDATRVFVADVEEARPIADHGPDVVVDAAVSAIRGLVTPRTLGSVSRLDLDGGRAVRVEVRGAEGRLVTLTWAGRPPQLVAVEQSESRRESDDLQSGDT
jgi:hypothetical protein